MRSHRWGLALGLLDPSILVHAVDTVIVRVPTGTCLPGAYTGSFNNGGVGTGSGSESGSGAASGPPKIVTGVDSSYGSYSLQSCYDASAGGYTITAATSSSTSMSLEYCASYCKGSPYFAIENGNTCICGSAGPSGPGVDIGEYGCMTSCTGNPSQCGGSPRYGIVYHCPRCTSWSGSSTVIVFPTTDSKGSTYLTSTTSVLPPTSVVLYTTTDSKGSSYVTSTTSTLALPSSSATVIQYTTTDSQGSSYLASTTSYVPAPAASRTVVVYTTTDSHGSTYVTSTTSTLPVSSPSTSVVVYSTTDSKGSTYVTSSTSTAPPASSGSGSATQAVQFADPSGKPSICPGRTANYTDPAGQTYQIYCGTDFPYNDLVTPHIDTFPQCLAACDNYTPDKNVANGAACVAISFGYGNPGGNCYLKYAIDTINTGNGGFDCARMVGYTPPNPTTVSLGEPGHSSQSSSPSGTNSPAGPQSSPGATTATAGQQTSPGGGGGAGAQSSPTAAGPTSSISASQSGFPCPSYDGIAYIDVNGEAYQIECGADYSYNDLIVPHTETFQECILQCDNYKPNSTIAGGAPCVGLSWGQGNTGGNCFLKYQITTTDYTKTRIDSAYKASYQKPGASIVASSSTSTRGGQSPTTSPSAQGNGNPTTSTSPATNTGSSSTTPRTDGRCGQAFSGATCDPNGAYGGCCSSAGYCGTTPDHCGTGCQSGCTTGGTSTSPGSSSPTSGTGSTGSGTGSSGSGSGAEPVCPGGNNTQYTNRYGTTYDIYCGVNPNGDNAKPAHADTFSKCLEFCDLRSGCAAVTWSGVAPAPQSNCYPYEIYRGGFSSAPDSICAGIPTTGPTNDDVGQGKLCPGNDGQPFVDRFGKTYTIGCNGQNATGTNLYDTQTNTLQGCLLHCSTYDTCVGVTFLGVDGAPLANSNDANCFPVSSNDGIIPQANCEYAVLAS